MSPPALMKASISGAKELMMLEPPALPTSKIRGCKAHQFPTGMWQTPNYRKNRTVKTEKGTSCGDALFL
jgi:hypothetical protein